MPRSINKTGIGRVSTASVQSEQTRTSVGAGAAAVPARSEYEPPAEVVEALQLSLLQGTMEDRVAVAPQDGTKRKKSKTSIYRKHQMEYMKWYGANPQNPGWLRGVQMEKRTWEPHPEFPPVTREWVILFSQEIYTQGFQWQFGRYREPHDPNPLWWKAYYQAECYMKTLPDDRWRTGQIAHEKNKGKPKEPQVVTYKGGLDKMLNALEDLKTQQFSSDPRNFAKIYNTADSKQVLRSGNKSKRDPRYGRIQRMMEARQVQSDAKLEKDKFADSLVDTVTFGKHLEMLDWYMLRGTYAGALQAMNAAAKFVAALRPSDSSALVLSDIGIDLTGALLNMPSWDKPPPLGFLYLGKNPDTNKAELSFYLPHKKDEANLFFYKGHLWFYRWMILRGDQPDFTPRSAETPPERSAARSSSGTSSKSSCGFCFLVHELILFFKNTTRLSVFTACTKCATDECVCRIGERWFNQRVLANATQNKIYPLQNMPHSTLTDANKECMIATGAAMQTSKRTACQRRLASVYLDGKVGVSDDHLGAFLHHAPKSTARAHYAIAFPMDCVIGIAGCNNLEGTDYDRISGLKGDALRAPRLGAPPPPGTEHEFPTLVYSTLPPWFKAWHIHILTSDDQNITTHQRRFMDDMYESMAQFIEGAARFRIDKVHQDYAFYGYPPFNVQGGEFDRFVTALHRAIEERRPQREHMQRSYRFLEAGEVGGAMRSAVESQINAHAIQLQENNNAVIQGTTDAVMQQLVPLLGNTVQSLGGRNAAALFSSLTTESNAGALTQSQTFAPSPPPAQEIDPKVPSTWPDDPSWIVNREPQLTLNKCPRTLVDLYNEWNFGHLNWPALRHLEEKYPRGKWRLRRVSFGQDVARIRLINSFMNTRADAKTLHRELCEHFKLNEQGGRLVDVKWSLMRTFLDKVLRPRTPGFAQRSADRSKRRKTVQTAASSSAAASAL